ncbi:hypothetical protein ADUPG1_002537 [Aduncisulcus paluster]|uniref:Uncharacterized protein n=1 Tax=Aduncisulcus paluster TaxID=2918883 RepID=A0ABQ5KNQ7_9EUKA|nr:hypothetical protein ADUPG1_002537 [Aduncisulcus paluster]
MAGILDPLADLFLLSQHKISKLVKTTQSSTAAQKKKIFEENRKKLLEIYTKNESRRSYHRDRKRVVMATVLLSQIMCTDIDGKHVFVDIHTMNDIFKTFIPHIVKAEIDIGVELTEWLYCICWSYSFVNKKNMTSLFELIAPSLRTIMAYGVKVTLEVQSVTYVLATCEQIVKSASSKIRDEILTVIRAHILVWLKKYDFHTVMISGMIILSNLTCHTH